METGKYRTGLKRFWAAVVDGIVFLPVLLSEQWMYKLTENITIHFSWVVFSTFLPIIYSITLHYQYGQTIGKWVAGVKVVDISETRKVSFRQSILRDLVYLIIEVVALCFFLILAEQSSDAEYPLIDYKNFSGWPLFIWTFLELVTMLTNPKRRAIHDFLAKSVVVRT
jgi:uncharacterized RDD family membrane protein YckC